jgi:DNA-binding Xre family transcriptional regulator
MIVKQLAKAIEESGQTRYQISRATGIDQAVLCRIATGSGTGSCSVQTLEVLCEYLGLKLVSKKKKKKKKKRGKK